MNTMKNRTNNTTLGVMFRQNINIFPNILIIQLLVCLDLTAGLRLRLDIPSIVRSGSQLWLHCDYDLENDSLYSVKWYKNNQEFYRYIIDLDSDTPEHKQYPNPGIEIDMSKSNSTHVLLKTTDLNSEGTYKAEVTTTSLKSVKKLKDLRIYVLPQKRLEIIGTKPEYKLGDEPLNLTCVAKKSKPVQILAWFINDVRVSHFDRRVNLSRPDIDVSADGLVSSSLGISLSLSTNDHLFNGVLTLRCSSIISQIYGVNFEELVIEEHGKYAGLQQTEGDYEQLGPDFSSPQIHGHNTKYNIGDIVDLNCSTPTVSPPPLLEWFINGRDALNSQLIIYSKPKEPDDNLMFSSTIYDNFADFEAQRRSSVLGLRFQITKEHYQTVDGKLRLRCSGTHAKIIGKDTASLVLSGGKQSSSLFASYAKANGIDFGRIVFSAFLSYLTVAWISYI